MGGECNFLLRAQREDGRWRLAFQPFQPEALSGFHEKDVADFLDVAESSLRDCILSMNLRATVLRKQRAVGLIPAAKAIPMLVESRAPSPTADRDPLSSTPNNSSAPTYGRASASFDGMQKPLPPVSYKMGREQLDECVIRTQNALRLMYARRAIPTPPHCVFNGGRDVWVDIGNKQLGMGR